MSEPQQHPVQPYGTPPPNQPYSAPQPAQRPQPAQYPGQQQPGQQQPGQQYPGQQYSAQPHPGSQHPAPTPSTSGASLGRVAFIVGLVTLGIELLRILSFPFLLRGVYDSFAIGLVSSVGSGIVLIAAVAAIVLGVIAVRRADRPILAGIAVGIGASALAGILISWLADVFFSLTY